MKNCSARLLALASAFSFASSLTLAADLTNAVVPDFRGWENTSYAGWTDWSGLDPSGFFALPDDPASNAQFARFNVSGGGSTLSSGGAGIICTDGDPTPVVQYGGTFGSPVHEVVVQIRGTAGSMPTVTLEYLGDIPFNPDTDYLAPVEVTQLAPDEFMYRFLAAPFGLSLGTFGNFYGFGLLIDADGAQPGCIDAVQLDVRHSMEGESLDVCGGTVANSLSVWAGMDVGGSSFASDNLLKLTASGIPPSSFGYFITSQTLGVAQCFPNCPGTEGLLCLSGEIARLGPAMLAGDDYSFDRPLDLTSIPLSTPTPVTAGSTWYFQAWFRDANPQVTSNFTQTISVLFQ